MPQYCEGREGGGGEGREGKRKGGSLIPHTLHFSAPFSSESGELPLRSAPASTPPSRFPPLPLHWASIPTTPQNRSYQASQKPQFARPGGHPLTRLTASSFGKHFISGPPGLGLSWWSSHAFLPSKHLRPQGSPGLPPLSCLHVPWPVTTGHLAFSPSHAPDLSPAPGLSECQLPRPEASMSSPLAHPTDLSKTEFFILIPQIMSPSALTALSLSPHAQGSGKPCSSPGHSQHPPAAPARLPLPSPALACNAAPPALAPLSQQPDNATDWSLSLPCHKQGVSTAETARLPTASPPLRARLLPQPPTSHTGQPQGLSLLLLLPRRRFPQTFLSFGFEWDLLYLPRSP